MSNLESKIWREFILSRKRNTDTFSLIYCNTSCTVEFTVAAHDTTGGMVTKISEAAMIAKLGIDVYIVKVITHNHLVF